MQGAVWRQPFALFYPCAAFAPITIRSSCSNPGSSFTGTLSFNWVVACTRPCRCCTTSLLRRERVFSWPGPTWISLPWA